jgi:hypothetical protein
MFAKVGGGSDLQNKKDSLSDLSLDEMSQAKI